MIPGVMFDFHSYRLDLRGASVLDRPASLVLDVRMSGQSDLDLQDRLAATEPDRPIVAVTAACRPDRSR
jgi:FixJ family two-component response regulator